MRWIADGGCKQQPTVWFPLGHSHQNLRIASTLLFWASSLLLGDSLLVIRRSAAIAWGCFGGSLLRILLMGVADGRCCIFSIGRVSFEQGIRDQFASGVQETDKISDISFISLGGGTSSFSVHV